MSRRRRPVPPHEIEPGYGWFGTEYRQVWRVYIGGRQNGWWPSPRAARRELRRQLRQIRRPR
jgi:hypothetical protein